MPLITSASKTHLGIHLYFKESDVSNIILRKLITKIYSSSAYVLWYCDIERTWKKQWFSGYWKTIQKDYAFLKGM